MFNIENREMNIGNNHENNHCPMRIAIGSGSLVVGAALLGPVMNSMLQSEPWPWWAIILLTVGSIFVITGLLVLIVPPKKWKRLWSLILGLPKWVCETYIWKRYGLKCTIGKPEITFEPSENKQMWVYKASIPLSIYILEKTGNYYPIELIFKKDTTTFQLKQKRGLAELRPIDLQIPETIRTLFNTPGKTTNRIDFSATRSNIPNTFPSLIDIQKSYEWIISGIEVHLNNINKFRKLSKNGKVSNAQKT